MDMHPSGPLPSEIYWRRRALAIGVVVVVVAIVAAVIFALVGGSAGADTKAAEELVPPVALNPGDDCPDATLAVKASTDKPSYLAGEQPKFTMVVTNIGLVQCKRDVGAAVLAASVFSVDNKRIWANLDCAPSQESSIKSFNPGEQVTTEVTWTGMGSAPNCPLPRPAIGPGTYSLVVQLGDLRSAPVPFIIGEKPADAPPPAGPPA